jgi:hypothetical protein
VSPITPGGENGGIILYPWHSPASDDNPARGKHFYGGFNMSNAILHLVGMILYAASVMVMSMSIYLWAMM